MLEAVVGLPDELFYPPPHLETDLLNEGSSY